MPDTYFAPAARATAEELKRQRAALAAEPLLEAIADSVTTRFLILNANRQIVYGNLPEPSTGKRHGEALGCIYAFDGPGGCGTSKACSLCGAAQAVVASVNDRRQTVRECRMVVEPFIGRDFEVTATPFDVAGEPFTLVFFEALAEKKPEAVVQAESGDLEASFQEVPVRQILDSLVASVTFPVEVQDSAATLSVDAKLLVYALANLVEYGAAAGAVAVRYQETSEDRTFVVETRRLIEKRAFMRLFDSGKPYIARLMTERVLGGRIWITTEDSGTASFHVGFGIRGVIHPR